MKASAFVASALAVALVAGCSATKENAPEPTPENIVNGRNTQVIRMPDGFRNIAFTCYGLQGVYVTSRGWVAGSADKNIVPLPSSISVVENDSNCRR